MSDERPQPMNPDEAELVGDAMDVQPETVQLPPGIRRGITLFELENGSFGFLPTTEDTSMMDAFALCSRMLAGIQADMTVQKFLQVQKQLNVAHNKAQAEAEQKSKKKSNLIIPRIVPGG